MKIAHVEYTVKYPSSTVKFLESCKGSGDAYINESNISKYALPNTTDDTEWVLISKRDVPKYALKGHDIWYIVGRGSSAKIYRSVTSIEEPAINSSNVSGVSSVSGVTSTHMRKSIGCIKNIGDVTPINQEVPVIGREIKPKNIFENSRKSECNDDIKQTKLQLINKLICMIEEL